MKPVGGYRQSMTPTMGRGRGMGRYGANTPPMRGGPKYGPAGGMPGSGARYAGQMTMVGEGRPSRGVGRMTPPSMGPQKR